MGQGVAAKLQLESVHPIMTVQGAAAEVQLGVTVGALVVLPTRRDPKCDASP